MRSFVGDDLFEPEVKPKIDEWTMPSEFKPEEQVEQSQQQKVVFKSILENKRSFSRENKFHFPVF